MNGFDVRALGWVATRDICAEMLRVAFGCRARTSPEQLAALAARWRAVQSSIRTDRSSRFNLSMVVPLTTPLSKHSEMAVVEFVDRLIASCPGLYGERALRNRWQSAYARFIISATFVAILAALAPLSVPIVRDAALVLLVMAGWSLVTTLQLWRSYRLVKQIGQHHSRPTRASAIRH
jgi:hypothetical protein